MIKSAHSILGLTLGFWKRPFSQAQHSPLPSDATLPTKMQSGRSACFLTVHLSTQHSWHASALFLPLYQLDGFYRRIQWWASWGIIRSEQKAKVRERGAAEIGPLHCSHIFLFFFVALFSSFYPPLTLIPFFFSLCLSLHLLLNDTQALTASPTDLPACDLPPLVEPFTGSAEVECLALGG